MRALVVALLLIVIIIIVLPSPARAVPPSPSPCTISACRVNITRTIYTNSWGVTIVTDKVTLNSTAPVSFVTLGVPASVSNNLRFFHANDTSGASLQISSSAPTSSQNYTALQVLFLATQTKYNFTLITVFSGLLTYSTSASSYSFSINPFPVTDGTYNTTATTTFSNAGGWASPTIAPPVNSTLQARCPNNQCQAPVLKPFNTTVWRLSFSSAPTQNIFLVSAGRVITITPSDSVQVADSYNLTNLGPTVSSIAFTLPKGVSNIAETYILGLEIDQPATTPTPTANADGTSTVTFNPNFGSVPYNQSVKVMISYVLSPATYLSSGTLGTFTLNFALFNNVQFYSPTLQTRIVTPAGFRLTTLTGQIPQTTSGQIMFQVPTVTPVSNLAFSITYQLDPFWASLSPLSWAGLVELALAASVVAVSRGPGAAAVTGVPVQTITKYVELYDEKSSMSLEADKMEEDLARGALNRFDYKQRRRSFDRRMSEIDRALASAKDELSSASGRYQDMVKRIERAEAELQVIRTTSADLRNQYRGGKLSKDLYESLSSDLIRRKEKARQSIDTIIINLREEIR